jgi:hypothetical protein
MSRFRGGGGVALKPENSLKRAEELIGVSFREISIRWEVYISPKQQQIVRRLNKADDHLRYAFLLIKLLGRSC